MADFSIPREAVDAAARAFIAELDQKLGYGRTFDDMTDLEKRNARETAMAMLNAAAPLLVEALLHSESHRDDLAQALMHADIAHELAGIAEDYADDALTCGGWSTSGPPCGDCRGCAEMKAHHYGSTAAVREARQVEAADLLQRIRGSRGQV